MSEILKISTLLAKVNSEFAIILAMGQRSSNNELILMNLEDAMMTFYKAKQIDKPARWNNILHNNGETSLAALANMML